jgi:hypothetical protein
MIGISYILGLTVQRPTYKIKAYKPLFSHVIASHFLAKQPPVSKASLIAWGLLRRKERSSQ